MNKITKKTYLLSSTSTTTLKCPEPSGFTYVSVMIKSNEKKYWNLQQAN